MLQQILQDMYVDPELLAELSDEQKQILFLKMREEQVRRWKEHEDKYEKEQEKKKQRKPKKPVGKKVDFLQGSDGNEWVWVMGEHPNDKSIEQILEEEAQQKALEQAKQEAEEQRKMEEEEIRRRIDEERIKIEEEKKRERKRLEEEALYQSIKEAQLKVQEQEKREEEENKRLKELQEVAAVERRNSLTKIKDAQKRRSNEIYTHWMETRQQLKAVAEETSQEVEDNWIESEKKAKEAEQQMKLIAQRAREENRHSFTRASQLIINANRLTQGEKPPLPPKERSRSNAALDKSMQLREERRKSRPSRPPDRNAVIDWFHLDEKDRKTVVNGSNGHAAIWFHGVISRMDAEKLLLDKPQGSYLVRVSEKVWGYTISYRASDRCKHFLIDATGDHYSFLGSNQLSHNSIVDLVNYHKDNSITVVGGEKLLFPCGQVCDPPDYWELFQGRQTESTSL